MKFLERFSRPDIGAASMLLLLATIELGQLAAFLYQSSWRSLFDSSVHQWMMVSSLISVSLAWRLIRSRGIVRRDFLIVLLHAAACWRFLSIELSLLATLPVFALAAALLLFDDPESDKPSE